MHQTEPVSVVQIIHKFDRRAGPDVMLANKLAHVDAAKWRQSLLLIDFERYSGTSLLETAAPDGIDVRTVAWRRGRGLPELVRTLRAMIADSKISIVHSHDIPSHLVATFAQAGVSRIASVHGIVDQTFRQHIWNGLNRVLLRRATRVIFGSPQIREQFPFVADDRSDVVWNAIDTTPFASTVRNFDSLRISGDRPLRLVCIARLSEEKGHTYLIDAMSRVASLPVTLDIIGSGPLRASLEERIRTSGIANVRLLGFADDIVKCLRDADVYCLASIRESLPLGVLEAMATGLPVIATDVGALRQVVADNGCGVVVPPADSQALADAIARFATSPGDLARMAERGPQAVRETHSVEAYTQRTTQIYDKVIRRARAPAT